MAGHDEDLHLTDFMDLAALQEIQDGFAAIAGVKAIITDPAGVRLTNAEPSGSFLLKRDVIATQEESVPETQRVGREYVAPIRVGNQQLGTIRMRGGNDAVILDDDRAAKLAQRFGLEPKAVKDLVAAATKDRNRRPAAIQFLFLMANAIARLCYQEYQLRLRINELQTISNVTMMLADTRDLNTLLQRSVKLVAELMNAKACSIRLLDFEHDELKIQAVYNLSEAYLNKGLISLSRSQEWFAAMDESGYELIRDMRTDPRVQYPEEAAREGLVSMLSVAMKSQTRSIGMLRVYTAEERAFSQSEITLLKAIAASTSAAIENARLALENHQNELLEQQIGMAADVQQRMIPSTPPRIPGIDLASVYVPCYQLGGDLFDFIELPYDNVGMVIADVSGKGVPASLVMASVRAALRAQADNVYYLGEIMHRLNVMLCRDTKATEFVTLFYGVVDTHNRRLTYCNAGHNPALLLRDGKVTELGTGDDGSMVLGVVEDEPFRQSVVDLRPGDAVLLYTDGLSEARSFDDELFGKHRVVESFRKGGKTADEIAKNLLWDLRRFVGLAPATDDVTIVVARVE
jgi:sigma-B regulation protein RsbU (phosphoserine phosphatase)